MANALNSMPLNIVQELFLNGHSRDEVITYIGLVTSHYATQSGIFPIEISQVRTCTCGLSVDATKLVLRALEEAELLWYDAGVMYLPLAATARNWTAFQFREKHMVAVYDAYADPGTNRAFLKWQERNPPTEKVAAGRKANMIRNDGKANRPKTAEQHESVPTMIQPELCAENTLLKSDSNEGIGIPSDGIGIPSDGIEIPSEGIRGVLDTLHNPSHTHRSPSDTPYIGIGIGLVKNGDRVYTGGVWGGGTTVEALSTVAHRSRPFYPETGEGPPELGGTDDLQLETEVWAFAMRPVPSNRSLMPRHRCHGTVSQPRPSAYPCGRGDQPETTRSNGLVSERRRRPGDGRASGGRQSIRSKVVSLGRKSTVRGSALQATVSISLDLALQRKGLRDTHGERRHSLTSSARD